MKRRRGIWAIRAASTGQRDHTTASASSQPSGRAFGAAGTSTSCSGMSLGGIVSAGGESGSKKAMRMS